MFPSKIHKALEKRVDENALRSLKVTEGLVDFCSNDYLGLAKLREPINIASGAAGSRLLSGNKKEHEFLEELIASYHGVESALLYTSGYTANLGLIPTVAKRGDTILYDEYVHASIRDGIKLSDAKAYSFKHNNLEDLIKKYSNASGDVFVILESVYSMDGDAPDVLKFSSWCKINGVFLIVDEAHSVGVQGEKGEGVVSSLQIQDDVFATILTYGKAFGTHGAAVLGSKKLKQFLINYSRAFIYTTALDLYAVHSIKKVYSLLPDLDAQRNNLKELISHFKIVVSDQQLECVESNTQIQGVVIKGNVLCKTVASELQNKGYDIRPVLYPTVPKGLERLRVSLHTFNTKEQINEVLKIIKDNING